MIKNTIYFYTNSTNISSNNKKLLLSLHKLNYFTNIVNSKIIQKKKNIFLNKKTNNLHKILTRNFCENKVSNITENIQQTQSTIQIESIQEIPLSEDIPNYNPEILDQKNSNFHILQKFPTKIQHYLKIGRYDKPIGYLLLFYPCAWGVTLGAPFLDLNYLFYLSLFFSGSVLMRSSGCIINDMWDRDIDKFVERSKTRPLASGDLTMNQAAVFLSVHLVLSLGILIKLPYYSIFAGLGIMPIVCIYPFMKRVTYFPQVFLGAAFNSGIIVGYPVLINTMHPGLILPFYVAGIFWTLIYDTIYAHMDKTDDIKINVKSTALFFKEKTKKVLYILNFFMILAFILGIRKYRENRNEIQEKDDKDEINDYDIKYFYELKISFSDCIILLAGLYQIYLIKGVNLNDPMSCLKCFKKNSYFGLLILAGIIAVYFEEEKKRKEM